MRLRPAGRHSTACRRHGKTGLGHGHRVAARCTSSGVVPIAGCEQGAAKVTATFTSDRGRAAEFGPYDLIVCNPPFVPHHPSGEGVQLPSHLGPARGVGCRI
jgi:release factor glutamine methyltransferase